MLFRFHYSVFDYLTYYFYSILIYEVLFETENLVIVKSRKYATISQKKRFSVWSWRWNQTWPLWLRNETSAIALSLFQMGWNIQAPENKEKIDQIQFFNNAKILDWSQGPLGMRHVEIFPYPSNYIAYKTTIMPKNHSTCVV